MKPTKYNWKDLEKLKINESVVLPMLQRPNAARAILRLHRGPYVFTTRKINDEEFMIRRVR